MGPDPGGRAALGAVAQRPVDAQAQHPHVDAAHVERGQPAHRLADPAEMGSLFKVLAILSPDTAVCAGFDEVGT